MSAANSLTRLRQTWADTLDVRYIDELTDIEDQAHRLAVGDLAHYLSDSQIDDVSIGAPLTGKLALRLALSKRYIHYRAVAGQPPIKLAVVFAMWRETNRLRPRSIENPNGEDCLRRKLDQLNWLFSSGSDPESDTPATIDWHVYAVDDGCPDGSADLARRIKADHPLADRLTILSLAELLERFEDVSMVGTRTTYSHPVWQPLKSVQDVSHSQKGGAIVYGLVRACLDGYDYVMHTDCDLSVHLGMIGNLLRPVEEGGHDCAFGVRRLTSLGGIAESSSNPRRLLGHLFCMLARSAGLTEMRLDTQSPFKLYKASALEKVLPGITSVDTALDSDLILGCLQHRLSFAAVGFISLDSDAESSARKQGILTWWVQLLQGLVRQVRSRGTPHDEAVAAWIENHCHSVAALETLMQELPPELLNSRDTDLGLDSLMPLAALDQWHQDRLSLS